MSQELELAARATQELEPAVSEFAEATGVLEPVRQLTTWLAEIIYYRRAPHKARLLMRAAAKIKAAGIPPQAVSDRLLRAVLEDGALEDDPEMQERWANLLAHEALGDTIPPSFPEILRQLEPEEARALEAHVDDDGMPDPRDQGPEAFGLRERQFDNLERLGLIRAIPHVVGGEVYVDDIARPLGSAIVMTWLAAEFVMACRDPKR